MKRLPGQNWSASLVPEIPRLGTGAFVTCRSGYYVWKNWDNWETSFNNGNLNTADKPIFKIEEVLLNEAEAKFELGVFDQGVADKTINKLRDRAGVVKWWLLTLMIVLILTVENTILKVMKVVFWLILSYGKFVANVL